MDFFILLSGDTACESKFEFAFQEYFLLARPSQDVFLPLTLIPWIEQAGRYNSCYVTLWSVGWPHQRTLTHFVRESITVRWPPVGLVWIQPLCLCSINKIFTCSVKSTPVRQEVSHTVILALTKWVSVLWWGHFMLNGRSEDRSPTLCFLIQTSPDIIKW